jgi:Cu(I)/Ag(I) efflux system membrane fusion protein
MHPEVRSDTPGQCPICKMDLVLQRPAAAPERASSPPVPAEVVPVELELDRAQAIGVRVAPATSGPGEASLRVTANVAAREGSSVEVRARAAGFVERLYVTETGTRVHGGQPLLALYSPEIYQALSDWSLARGWALGDAKAGNTLAAAERRLELLGVSPQTLQQARESQEVPRTITLSAPATGFVLEKNVALGAYVTPETLLYRVVDLARVFVIADVPSSDAAQVVRGQKARFHPASRAERMVEGEVDLVYPSVAGEARTLRLRLSVDNRKLGLMPGEYGTLELALGATELVWVPRDALIDTGLSRYVFVEVRPGRYEPRAVTTGAATAERVSISSGLTAGERVVSGATFLLDAESRLRAALSPRASEPAAGRPAAPASQP